MDRFLDDNNDELENIGCDTDSAEVKHSKIIKQIELEFFSTNEKFLNNLDNQIILNYLIQYYPMLGITNTDLAIKKTILEILGNKIFLEFVFKRFNINIYDFFKILCKDYGNLFKGQFLKKIQFLIASNNYERK